MILFFVLTVISGWGIVSLFETKYRLFFLEKSAFAYGVGMGVISLEAFFVWQAGFNIPVFLLYAPWVVLAAFCVVTRRNLSAAESAEKKQPYTVLEKFILAAIILELGYTFFRAVIYPMESYDSVAIWALKAKAIYIAGGIPAGFFKNPGYITAHFDYPVLIPIQEALFYKMRGVFDDAFVKAIFPMYLASMAAIMYGALRKPIGRRMSLIFTFLLTTVPIFNEYATNGYADIVIAFYYSSGLIAIYRWMTKKDAGLLVLSAVMSAIAAWTKPEGVFLCLLNLCVMAFAVFLTNEKRIKTIAVGAAAYIIALAVFLIPWNMFTKQIGVSSDLITAQTFSPTRAFENLNRLPTILYEYQKQFFGFKKWNILWVLFWVVFLINFKKIFRHKAAIPTLSIIGAFSIYTIVYILTPKDFGWHLRRSLARVMIHFLPIVILWLAAMYENGISHDNIQTP